MTKEEKIQEAYGEYWEAVKDFVDISDGSIDVHYWIENDLKIPFERVGFSQRVPKSIIGILNNNGWIKIESEEDLPKEECILNVYPDYEEKNIFFYDNIVLSKDEIIRNHTHYQPIIKPQPPIY